MKKHVLEKYDYTEKVFITKELPVRHRKSKRSFIFYTLNLLAHHDYLQIIPTTSSTTSFTLTEEEMRLVTEAEFSLQEALTFTSLQDVKRKQEKRKRLGL